MNPSELNEHKRQSALDIERTRERNADLKADMAADELMNARLPRKFTFIGETNNRDEALEQIERDNVEASRNNY